MKIEKAEDWTAISCNVITGKLTNRKPKKDMLPPWFTIEEYVKLKQLKNGKTSKMDGRRKIANKKCNHKQTSRTK